MSVPPELDCRAMLCPQPIIELARHLGDVEVGEELVLLATDPAARHDVAAWCRMRGQELVSTAPDSADAATTRYVVRRLS
jgi:TusA-related sulfurtransferase